MNTWEYRKKNMLESTCLDFQILLKFTNSLKRVKN